MVLAAQAKRQPDEELPKRSWLLLKEGEMAFKAGNTKCVHVPRHELVGHLGKCKQFDISWVEETRHRKEEQEGSG